MSDTLTSQDAADAPGSSKRAGSALGAMAALCILGASLYGAYELSLKPVSIEVNGAKYECRTHESTGQAVLDELGLSIGEHDIVVFPPDDDLWRGEPIAITAARDVAFVQDGDVERTYSLASNLREALFDLGVSIYPNDRFWVDGVETGLYDPLPSLENADGLSVASALESWRTPLTINVRRAVPITIQDGDLSNIGFTAQRTVGQALYEHNITVREGDIVTPAMDVVVTSGMGIEIKRATPIVLSVAGTSQALCTQATTVGELLAAEGLSLGSDDYVQPGTTEQIMGGDVVNVVRVHDEYIIQEAPVPYEEVVVGDPNLEIDDFKVVNWGAEGAERTLVRVHYVNGQEEYRTEETSWLEREPQPRESHYGTGVVERTLSTPDAGELTYWRVIRMLATSYNAATAGTPPWASWYGYTRLGWPAGKGIVAVDPDVIPLRTEVYVPGYGRATAADTGSAIVDRHIDLCYDDDNLVLWYKWVDVYLLTPVPSASDICWMVPNNPIEKE